MLQPKQLAGAEIGSLNPPRGINDDERLATGIKDGVEGAFGTKRRRWKQGRMNGGMPNLMSRCWHVEKRSPMCLFHGTIYQLHRTIQ